MNVPFDTMIKLLQTEETKSYVRDTYPRQWEYFERFSSRNGPNCPYSRAALRDIFAREFNSKGQRFLSELTDETWGRGAPDPEKS